MRYSVIIPAAGSGSRMGAGLPKVFLRLSEQTGEPSIIQRTVDTFCNDTDCERIVVCVHPEWRSRFEDELVGRSKVTLVSGGASRQESVRRGVEELVSVVAPSETDTVCVLVHDAARCCVSIDVVRRVVAGVNEYGAVTAAIPVPDSLGSVSDGVLRSFVDRSNVWAIQTPQGFRLMELSRAHHAASEEGFIALDDASVVARIREVRVVEGDRRNIKITHRQDLAVARQMSREV